MHLPDWVETEWLKQLAAEQLVTVKTKRGFARLECQKLRERNEALDTRVYARAAAWIAGLDRWSEERWAEAERKQAVIDELREQGIPFEVLREAVPKGEEFDPFDLVAHIAFNQPPLSRRERAERVKKRNYFSKYGDDARAVLEALLEKYADHGISDIEDPRILELPPFVEFGTKTQIRRSIFGGNGQFSKALTELERAIYDPISA